MGMKSLKAVLIIALVALPILVLMSNSEDIIWPVVSKINGVNYVSSRTPMQPADAESVVTLGSNYISIIPYAFIPGHQPEVYFDVPQQWYGERIEGTLQMIEESRKKGLKIMLKPHVWVRGDGWAGEFKLETEEEWKKWEKAFDKYILTYAEIADSLDIEIFCFATEFRMVIREHPEYFPKLISKVREVYKGKLTYASNWDNYENVQFWDQLDYIGVDAYFPICDQKTPEVDNLIGLWDPVKKKLKGYADKHNKPILFTEYGYQSIDFSASEHWNISSGSSLNMVAQRNAYEAIYKTFWDENWFAGGFLWKWYPNHPNAGGKTNKRFTPQNKPAEKVVSQYYNKYTEE